MILNEWVIRWGIPEFMVDDLRRLYFQRSTPATKAPQVTGLNSEAGVSQNIRLEAPKRGISLWRNNVGAVMDPVSKRLIRYGLCNDSKKINLRFKSSDLIGISTKLITPDMIGHTIGQFTSLEVKRRDWAYSGTPEEQAQLNWISLVNSLGGKAYFITDEKDLK